MSKLKQTRSKLNSVNQIVSLNYVPSMFSTKFYDSKNIIAIFEYFSKFSGLVSWRWSVPEEQREL